MSNQSNNSYLSEMLLALEANIEYLRQEGSSKLLIKNGQLLENVADIFIYEFTLDFFHEIEPDTEIEVRVRNESANGRVIATYDKNIQIELDNYIGTEIHEASLIISSYYLLQLLYEKLRKVENGEIKLSNLAEKVFKLMPAKIGSDNDYQIPYSLISEPPNISQESAIRLSIGSEVSFIWGPPGTGKTKTIARIIEGFLARELSVLLIAHTNIATDGALYNVVEHLKDSDTYLEGKILRVGDIQKSELKKFEMVIPDVVIDKRGISVKSEIDQLAQNIKKISNALELSERVVNNYNKYNALEQEETKTMNYIDKREKEISSTNEKLIKIISQLSEIDKKIAKSQSIRPLFRLLSGLNLDKLINRKTTLLLDKGKHDEKLIIYNDKLSIAKDKLKEIILEKTSIESVIEGIDIGKHRLIIEHAQTEINNLSEQKMLLQKQLDEMANNLIKEAKIIATTITRSYSSKAVLDREYDCVIVDEASMAPLPALWCAAGLAKAKVVIVGDFYQLPPIVKHRVINSKDKTEEQIQEEEALVYNWLKKDIFQVVGILNDIKMGVIPNCLKQLKKQYRMHPDIANVLNKLVYGESGKQFELESDEGTKENGKELLSYPPLIDAHLGIYDTSKIGSFPIRTDSGSYYNLYHSFLAVQLAKEAIESGYKSVGIISPFRAQINLTKKIVTDKRLGEKIKVDTVHRFQGGEEQIIILDIVTSQPTKLTDDKDESGDDKKLLNVAFSRAKEKLILIADVKKLDKKHSLNSLLRQFVSYCEANKYPINSSEKILSNYYTTDEAEKWIKLINNVDDIFDELEKSKPFDETDFYKYFISDLFEAKQEIIIDSPYITYERVKTFLPIFHLLIKNKGIKIFIITRQPTEHSPLMKYQAEIEIANFEELGIVVLPFRGKIHRKLAIIDRNILWEGSLNILSQRESGELMRRSVGEATSQQIVHFLKLDKNIGKIGENNLQRCEFCKKPGAWYWTDKSKYGHLWTFCLAGRHKIGKEPKSRTEREKAKHEEKKMRESEKRMTDDGRPICPKHDSPMIKRKGRFGEFWACQKYPACKVTDKIQ